MTIELKEKIEGIKALVFDVDGVFTNATLLVGENDVQRIFNVKDGYAVQVAARLGYELAVISGGKQESIRTRLSGLGIENIHIAVSTYGKLEIFDSFLNEKGLKAEQVLYIGDDLPDLQIMSQRDVFSACPCDAVPEVLEQANYITEKKGGEGAVREVIELVLKAKGDWMKIL
ncbi:3-deoxy-D-manno-octulosonate 8-phosphate phosphatase (KDO 8-P phosphatase) [Spirosomataceae bacterium TFI 002]|nr:3-deoxy-D-manno-octulosonate 8-phosphate phosphatase (KDO 8-P phosphatase) [Spirosomataceae bacterium TFI 002]